MVVGLDDLVEVKIVLLIDCYFEFMILLFLWLCCKKYNGICEFYLCYTIK